MAALVAKLPVQTCRFKLRIAVNLCENPDNAFLDTMGLPLETQNAIFFNVHRGVGKHFMAGGGYGG
jgi:hypothetical protein